MLRLVTSDINVFKSSFGAISSIVNVIEMKTDERGIEVNAIDGSHITFVHLYLNESIFDIYECDTPKTIVFDSNEFTTYLKRVNKDSLLEISVDENHLIIHSEGKTNKTFKMKLLDSDSIVPPIPKIDFPVSIMIPTKVFKETISDIVTFSQKVRFENDDNVIKFSAVGDFTDVEIEWIYDEKITESCKSNYSLDKINEMMKADKFSRDCCISYGTDMPMKLDLISSEDEILSFILAHRIEEE